MTTGTFTLYKESADSKNYADVAEFIICEPEVTEVDNNQITFGCIVLESEDCLTSDVFEVKIVDLLTARSKYASLLKDGWSATHPSFLATPAKRVETPKVESKKADENVLRLRDQLAHDEGIQVAALLALYAQQTSLEQRSETTYDHNQRGFNAFDAEILSSFAKQFTARHFLSSKQFNVLSCKLPKYAKQVEKLLSL